MGDQDQTDHPPVVATVAPDLPGLVVEAEGVEAAAQWDDRLWQGSGGWPADPVWRS